MFELELIILAHSFFLSLLFFGKIAKYFPQL